MSAPQRLSSRQQGTLTLEEMLDTLCRRRSPPGGEDGDGMGGGGERLPLFSPL